MPKKSIPIFETLLTLFPALTVNRVAAGRGKPDGQLFFQGPADQIQDLTQYLSGLPMPQKESKDYTEAEAVKNRFHHYYRPCPYDAVDIYRILKLFQVTDPCIQHAIKKLMVAGGRGGKDFDKDISEVIATLTRLQAMRKEDNEQCGQLKQMVWTETDGPRI